jgi:hypothetical protein
MSIRASPEAAHPSAILRQFPLRILGHYGDEVRSGLGKVVALILPRSRGQEAATAQVSGEVGTDEVRAAS